MASDPSSDVERYINDRLEQYAGWYDAKAVVSKRNYMRARITAAIASVLTPVIANWSIEFSAWGYRWHVSQFLTTVVSTTVAVLLALEGVLRHREQWRNYRTTEQYLRAQLILFRHRVGDYEQLSETDAAKRLVLNAELAIKAENEVTLNVLARSDASSVQAEEKKTIG